jgi:Delta3-Delta2-enoyl-CoA isomerase
MSMIEWTVDENIAVLSMNSGENRFNIKFCNEMLAALDEIENTTKVNALVVKSNHEKIWHNGIDLDWLVPAVKRNDPDVKKFFLLQDSVMRRMLFYPMITVATLTGHAFASGAIFSCCFDFRFMRSDRGFVCFPEVDLNITYLPYMPVVISKCFPFYAAEEGLFSGKRFTATELEKCHFIRKSCAMDELVKESVAFAKGLNKERWIISEMKQVLRKDIWTLMELPPDVGVDPDNTPIK